MFSDGLAVAVRVTVELRPRPTALARICEMAWLQAISPPLLSLQAINQYSVPHIMLMN